MAVTWADQPLGVSHRKYGVGNSPYVAHHGAPGTVSCQQIMGWQIYITCNGQPWSRMFYVLYTLKISTTSTTKTVGLYTKKEKKRNKNKTKQNKNPTTFNPSQYYPGMPKSSSRWWCRNFPGFLNFGIRGPTIELSRCMIKSITDTPSPVHESKTRNVFCELSLWSLSYHSNYRTVNNHQDIYNTPCKQRSKFIESGN